MNQEIESWIFEKIKKGEAILFLGAGASFGAKMNGDDAKISGEILKEGISDTFLGGKKKTENLSKVAELAKTYSSLYEVQKFVRDIFNPLQPADFHKRVSSFRWHSIFTTNYDLVLERAYDQTPNKLQILQPILGDNEQIDHVLRDSTSLAYFKLHGCITRINDEKLPLILAREQYAKYKSNRERLFEAFRGFAKEYPIIFCGYRIDDSHIEQILFSLDGSITRPRFCIVDPSLDAMDIKYWSGRNFAVYNGTLSGFVGELEQKISKNQRLLSSLSTPNSLSFHGLIAPGKSLSYGLTNYVASQLQHIHSLIAAESEGAIEFYRGYATGWSAYRENLDVVRTINKELAKDLVTQSVTGASVKLYLVKGYAGCGKSVALRRLAWDLAADQNAAVFYLPKNASFIFEYALELVDILEVNPIFIIDDIVDSSEEISKLNKAANSVGKPIRIVSSARTNEWNSRNKKAGVSPIAEYEIGDLRHSEIESLVDKLETNNCLGVLTGRPKDEIVDIFKDLASKILIVALYEATSGKSFESIISDEFQRIPSEEARLLYLDVCTLNRFNVPVRAGLISRISEIRIETFRERFFEPLEHIIRTQWLHRERDYAYEARHSWVARVVFENAFKTQEEAGRQIIRVIKGLNPAFETDDIALTELIRGRTLADVFGDKAIVSRIYEEAATPTIDQSFVYHQRAVFELNHKGGDLNAALRFIQLAEKNWDGGTNFSMLHTKANIFRKLSIAARNISERDAFRTEAKIILNKLIDKKHAKDSRAFSTLCSIYLDEIEERVKDLSSDTLETRARRELMAKFEKVISTGLQLFPNDPHLASAQSRFWDILKNREKAIDVLKKAWTENSDDESLCGRYARYLEKSNDFDEALLVLRRGLHSAPQSKQLNFQYAKLLIRVVGEKSAVEIIAKLKRSFSSGDSNHLARFWYARQQYLWGDRKIAKLTFFDLRQDSGAFSIDVDGVRTGSRYRATIKSDRGTYCFLYSSELDDMVYCRYDKLINIDADQISVEDLVEFELSFSTHGPCALEVVKVA